MIAAQYQAPGLRPDKCLQVYPVTSRLEKDELYILNSVVTADITVNPTMDGIQIYALWTGPGGGQILSPPY